jgi:HlyD family secretion protein
MQQFRARIQSDLNPTEAQKAQIEEIYSDARQKFARVRDMKAEGDRRREAEKIRAETNARIGEILTAEQRPAWERLLAESGSRGQATSGRLYQLEGGQPKPVDVRLGLTDGSSTEVISGVNEGADVIIGTVDTKGGSGASGGLPRGRIF